MKEFEWHFPSTDHGDEDGINNAGIETFGGNPEHSVARECIQNSIDARTNQDKPVLVRFERIDMASKDVPGLDQLLGILKSAKEYSKSQDKSESLYGTAIKMLSQKTIPVLKISDFNTTGLSGDDTDQDGSWYKLVCADGVNSMNSETGGGSFGIGKSAAFAASALRTVFYSTKNQKDDFAFQGKAKLSSFKNDQGDVRRGSGRLGEISADGRPCAVRESQQIPAFFLREEQGTDLYIIGYKTKKDNWAELLLHSILNHFWAAIRQDDLDIEIYENGSELHAVGETNLKGYMEKYANGDGDSYPYYLAVTQPSVPKCVGNLPHLGKVFLFIRQAEGLPRKIQLMRKAKMLVDFYQPRTLNDEYSAVFFCEDDKGNKLLRELEPPAHDRWDPTRAEWGKKIEREYKEWIRQQLKSLISEESDEPEDIPGLSQWLPELIDEDALSKKPEVEGDESNSTTDKESIVELGVSRPPSELQVSAPIKREVEVTKRFAQGERKLKAKGKKKAGTGESAPGVDETREGDFPRIDPSSVDYKIRPSKRGSTPIYQLVVTAQEAQAGAISIVASGEDNDYPIEIASASDENGKEFEIKGSSVLGLDIQAEKPLKLFVELKNHRRYTLGLN